jgi:16S rRNA G966 N2-methylase RsmD
MDYKNNALYNQNLYNKLSQKEKDEFIEKVYKYYNSSLPIIEYNIKNIENQFDLLKSKQNFKIDDKDKKNIVVDDIDYKRNYIDYCSLSDYYQNKERIKCQVKKYPTPYNYYKKNYKFILNKYFSNMYRFYEDGFVIDKIDLNKIKDPVNPIYLQTIIYENNKFCTVFKPYLFKLLVNIFRDNKKANVLDLSSGWGDRLIAMLSIQNDINLYVGIDPNKNLFKGYKKMIDDLCEKKNKDKFILINKPAEDVKFNELPEFDIIFWSPPFFDQEIYITDKSREDYKKQSINTLENYTDWENNFLIDTIKRSSNNLKDDGYLILYLGNINYKTFMDKMKNIVKLNYIGDLKVKTGSKHKNYMIYKK